MKAYFTAFTIFGLGALSACGGASTGASGAQGSGTPAVASNYNNLSAQSGGASTLAGAALNTNTSTGSQSVGEMSGQLRHWNGKLTITNGVATFTADSGGLNLGGTTQGTDGSSLVTTAGSLGAGYQYLTVFQSYAPAAGNGVDAIGVLGISTQNTDMPSGGTATYTGNSEAMLVTQSNGAHILTDGTAVLSVDFGTGKANLLLNQFTATTPTGAAATGTPVQSVRVWNMNINGSTISGGQLVVNPDSDAATPLGNDPSLTTQGQFFGYDATTGTPKEAGGVVHAEGDMGVFSAVYVAK